MKKEKPIILVDGSSYLYRAFHALPMLATSKGQPTGAIYGVLNMLRSIIKEYDPKYMAVIFDAKGKTFRDEIYADYKATRPPMPDELESQFEPLVECIKAFGIALFIEKGVEADDVIGTLAKTMAKKGHTVLVSSGDKDMTQLIDSHITIINTMTNKILDSAATETKFGVQPKQIIDYLALIGDNVDNVPGIPNVGPKTAAKWLQKYGSIEKIIEHENEIKGKVGENFRANLEQLFVSRELVTIKIDLKLDIALQDLILRPNTEELLIPLFQKLELRSWLNDLLKNSKPKLDLKYDIIWTIKELNSWLDKAKKAKYFALDLETTSLNVIDAKIVGISLAVQEGKACYIPIGHDESSKEQLSLDEVLPLLQQLLSDHKKIVIGHNIKYDLSVLKNYDIDVNCILYDTMIESYVLNSSASRHDLDTLALKWLGKRTISYKDITGSGKKQKSFNEVDVEHAAQYAAEDADVTFQLHEKIWPEIKNAKTLVKVCQDMDFPLINVLSDLERKGVLIDVELLQTQGSELGKKITILQKKAYDIAKTEFNLNSPKQLQEILYGKFNLPIIKKTPKGQPSTAEAVLTELSYDYPLPKIILEYRSLSKLKSTYLDALPLQVNSKTNRVHTSYNQAVTTTGRLSSTDPNLQNIPIRTEEGRKIRKAFIAPNGYKIMSFDYSQIELRIMAHLAKDDGLIDAFKNNMDIHKFTAAEVFNVDLDKVSFEQRRRAKAINFGLIYGMSPYGLSKQLGIEQREAKEYVELYFARYPGVKKYMDKTKDKADRQGYVETLFDRRVYLPEIHSKNFARQSAAQRAAINAPLQGTSADIIKLAMINIDKWLKDAKIEASMIMQVHDELVFEVKSKDIDKLKEEVVQKMQNVVQLIVPIEVDVGVGNSWEEAH